MPKIETARWASVLTVRTVMPWVVALPAAVIYAALIDGGVFVPVWVGGAVSVTFLKAAQETLKMTRKDQSHD